LTSLFSRILIWFVGSAALAVAGLYVTSTIVSARLPGRIDFIAQTQQLELDSARQLYDLGGRPRLAEYLGRLDKIYRARHVLLDRSGVNLVDGSDQSELARRAASRGASPGPREGRLLLSRVTDDGAYRLVIFLPPPFRPLQFLPYFLWIVLAVIVLGYLVSMQIARPLRALRLAVERFGRGDLAARFGSSRRDEIGELGRSFDHMAGQIETLLTAERRLLQDVSHELRSPLTRLGFALELARTARDRDAALARARKEADRLANLVDELLQLTRAEGDPAARLHQPVALKALLRDLVEDCELEAQVKQVALVLRADQPVSVEGDPELLRRAVENAVRNAIRHAQEQSPVEISLELVGTELKIAVRDHGTGVPEDRLEDLFKPFFRVESARDRASGGVGLGLAIARRAVELHQGTIRARNASPGLEIVIQLPHASAGLPRDQLPLTMAAVNGSSMSLLRESS
jgi:two-component system sensor histidine kinase CpxA